MTATGPSQNKPGYRRDERRDDRTSQTRLEDGPHNPTPKGHPVSTTNDSARSLNRILHYRTLMDGACVAEMRSIASATDP